MKGATIACAAFLVLTSALINAQQAPQSPPHPNPRQPPPSPPQQQQQEQLPSPQPNEDTPPPQEEEEIHLRCLADNGTVPHWLDESCHTYLSCVNYTLSLKTCEDNLVYNWTSQSCVDPEELNCTVQNENFANIIRAILLPHFYQNIPTPRLPLVPFFANNDDEDAVSDSAAGRGPVDDESDEDDDDEGGMTIDLADLPVIIVDNSNAFNITLPAETCQKLGGSVHQLEVSMNTALLMLVGCPQNGCDVPLFSVDC